MSNPRRLFLYALPLLLISGAAAAEQMNTQTPPVQAAQTNATPPAIPPGPPLVPGQQIMPGPGPGAAPPTLPTPDPKRLAAAKELVGLMDSGKVYKNVFEAMSKNILTMASKENPGSQDKLQKLITDTFSKAMASHADEIVNNNAIVYGNNFTEEELQEMAKFYKTLAGQKLLKTQQQVVSQSMMLNQAIITKTMRESMASIREQMKKEGMTVPKGMGI